MIRRPGFAKRRGSIDKSQKQRKKYPDIAKEVIGVSDIILEILDARFIDETRNKELEELIKSKGKKLIYIINKIDLADMDKVKADIASQKLYPYALVSCKRRRGCKHLRDMIKIEASRINTHYERKQVGIIGYPNTGKSSMINFLAGGPSAKTSSESGFTKSMQKVRLTKEVLLLDTPGVIPFNEDSNIYARDLIKQAKIGMIDYNHVKEPEFVVSALMKKSPGVFEKYYNIDANGDSEILIEQLGRKRNFLKKGGIVDEDRTARSILKDMQENKLKLK